MSGGSHEYVCYRMEDELAGKMGDPEMNDLINDIIKVAHDLEWRDSGDIEPEDYDKSVAKFKKKWFQNDRKLRLKKYIDESTAENKRQLYRMIGVNDHE